MSAGVRTDADDGYRHVPVVPPRIGPTPPRPEPDLLAVFRASPVPDVSDLVGRLYTLHAAIHPLWAPVPRLVGPALTVKAHPGDNLAVHGALARVQPGDVLVVDWQGYHEGCGSGAASLLVPAQRGLAGIVVDGGWRDVEDLQRMGLPVFGRAEVAFSPAKREVGELNVPVCCGGVVVEAGDIIVADAEGVAVVPRRHAQVVAAALSAGRDQARASVPEDLAEQARRRAEDYAAAFRRRGGDES